MANNLLVRAGQELTAALWNAFWKQQRLCRLRSGPGVYIKDTSDGQIITFRGGGNNFVHPWKATLWGSSVIFRLGLVNGLEPLIDGVPISGEEGGSPPRLQLDETLFDDSGRSWGAIRLQVDSSGKIIQPDEKGQGELMLEMVQVASLNQSDDTVHLHPVFMLRRPRGGSGFGVMKQIAMFDYQHRTAKRYGRFMHFVDPA